MKNPQFILLSIFISFCNIVSAQQAEITTKKLSTSTFFAYEKQKIFTTETGSVYYISFAEPGYFIEKFDASLNSKKYTTVTFPEENNNEYTQPILLGNDIYIITASYIKKEKESEIKISKLNAESLLPENEKSLMKVPGKIGKLDLETQTRIIISQSESKQIWSISVFIGKDFVKNAEFIAAAYDLECNELWNKRFQVDYVNYAFMKPQSKTDNDGNVYIESRMVFQHVMINDGEYHHIFCITEKGNTLKIINFENNGNLSMYSVAIESLAEEKLFVYAVTNQGLRVYLIDGRYGKILEDKPVEIDLALWKKSAFYTDSKLTSVGMYFPAILVESDSEGNIYVVGEQMIVRQYAESTYYNDYLSVIAIKFNSILQQQWYTLIPKIQTAENKTEQFYSTNAILEQDKLSLVYNYSVKQQTEKDLFNNGKLTINSYPADIKEAELIKIDISADGVVTKQKVIENKNYLSITNGNSSFVSGTGEIHKENLYFIIGEYCNAGLNFGKTLTCEKHMAVAKF